jgi:hypothetical protein
MSNIANDPNALAAYISNLGGQIVEAPTFRFEIPLAVTKRIIPEIYRLGGLRCERVSERVGTDATNGTCQSVVTIEVRRKLEEDEHRKGTDLMAALIR